jgi:tRNA-specific 2-thiouridylase
VTTAPGDIIDKDTGKTLGRHDGALFYTLGQRHGLDIGGGLPYYVVSKDIEKNIVYVSQNINDENMWRDTVELSNMHWIQDSPKDTEAVQARIRHRATLVDATIKDGVLSLHDAQRAITPGQSVVLYQNGVCLGGGIVA